MIEFLRWYYKREYQCVALGKVTKVIYLYLLEKSPNRYSRGARSTLASTTKCLHACIYSSYVHFDEPVRMHTQPDLGVVNFRYHGIHNGGIGAIFQNTSRKSLELRAHNQAATMPD